MSWTWETWVNGRKIIHRKSSGQFDKNNFHMPKSWRRFGHIVTKETREKIRETLKGQPFTEKRKRNISKATKVVNYKWAKGCKHGIIPISNCRECMNERLKEWRIKNKDKLNKLQREKRSRNRKEVNRKQREYRHRKGISKLYGKDWRKGLCKNVN